MNSEEATSTDRKNTGAMISARWIAVIATVALAGPLSSVASSSFSGKIIVAKNSQDPVLIWQASRELYQMIGDGATDQQVDNRLAHDALKGIASKLRALTSKKGELSLKIMYNKMTANGLKYEVFTLAGALEYAEVKMPLRDARRNRDHWMDLSEEAKIPAWIHYQVVGKLPGQ